MNQKEYIGRKIREFRESRLHVSARKLGEMLVPPKNGSTITSWETARTEPDADTMIQLCILFGADVSDFYYKSPEYEIATESDESPAWVEVPLYGSIAAGTPIEMETVENTFIIPAELRKRYPRAFLLKVEGESMNKKLPNGSYALIDPTDEVLDGNAYAVCVNGHDATIKRVRKLENGFELMPDSTDPTIKSVVYDYGEEGTEQITVIGEVVWYCVPFGYSI